MLKEKIFHLNIRLKGKMCVDYVFFRIIKEFTGANLALKDEGEKKQMVKISDVLQSYVDEGV
jgi:hypothetical protein